MIQQKTNEWFELRRGKFTSSNIYKLLGKSLNTEVAKTYILERLSQRLGTTPPEKIVTNSMLWGEEHEPIAFQLLENYKGYELEKSTFCLHKDYDFFGGSSDGENSRLELEIKCPYNSIIHLKHLQATDKESLKKVSLEYYSQLQSNMLIKGKEVGLFVSFDPRLPHDKGLHIVEINQDKDWQNFIIDRVLKAEEMLNEFQNQYIND